MARYARNALSILSAALLVACGPGAPPMPPAGEPGDPAAAAPPPLIERERLFGNPERAGGAISPDGRWLGYIAPRDGVLNVYVAPSDEPGAARPVTNDRLRGIRNFRFAYTGNHVLYGQDVGGDENFQVFAVDLTTGEERALTPAGSRAGIAALSSTHPGEVVVNVNDRDPTYFDLLRVKLETGEQTRLIENTQFGAVYVDDDFELRYAVRQTDDGGDEYFERAGEEWRSWTTVPQEDTLTTQFAGLTHDGSTLYLLDSRGRNTAGLFAIDTLSGERALLHEDTRADVDDALAHPATGVVQAAAANYLRDEWTAIDPAIAADLERLRELAAGGEFRVTSRTQADDRWVVAIADSTAPARFYLYDRATGSAELWFETRPALAGLAA
ncbi:MAG TPA: S9 family peptidase, partial [Gammaproteobacteria bacterium]|nr:S9 family peptidase [Gammaproteobacteria bacterium]